MLSALINKVKDKIGKKGNASSDTIGEKTSDLEIKPESNVTEDMAAPSEKASADASLQ